MLSKKSTMRKEKQEQLNDKFKGSGSLNMLGFSPSML